jgi:hypothetical protein
MASQDAELRLKVSLDLAFFRQEMQKVSNIASSEFTGRLAVKFNRQTLDTELNNLQKAIKRRTYRIEIGGNLEKAPNRVKSLKDALASLDGTKVNIDIGGIASIKPKEARKIRTALTDSILSQGGKIRVPTSIITAITQADVTAFKQAVEAKLAGIKVKVGIEESARSSGAKAGITPAEIARQASEAMSQGLSAELFSGQSVAKARTDAARAGLLGRLGKASLQKGGYNKEGLQKVITELGGTPSGTAPEMRVQATKLAKEASDAVIAKAWQTVESLKMSMQPLRGQQGVKAVRSALNIDKILDPIAALTKNPEAARRMMQMLPESRISTNTLDVASKQSRYYETVPSARSFQAGIKGFDPLLKSIANDFANYTKSLSPTNPWVGKIGQGIAQIVSTAATAAPRAQKLLPAAGQSSADRMIRPAFAGLPALQAPSIGQEKAPLSKAATYALNKARKLLGMPIGPSSAYQPNPWAGTATVPPVRPMPASLALPPAGATSNYGAARKTTMAQAYQQGGFRQAPPIPPPARPPGAGAPPPGAGAPPPPTPPSPPQPPAGGAGGFGGMGAVGRAMGGSQLPGAGGVREIGSAFAMVVDFLKVLNYIIS